MAFSALALFLLLRDQIIFVNALNSLYLAQGHKLLNFFCFGAWGRGVDLGLLSSKSYILSVSGAEIDKLLADFKLANVGVNLDSFDQLGFLGFPSCFFFSFVLLFAQFPVQLLLFLVFLVLTTRFFTFSLFGFELQGSFSTLHVCRLRGSEPLDIADKLLLDFVVNLLAIVLFFCVKFLIVYLFDLCPYL